MLLSEINAIYFDAVGTLLHPDPPARVVYAEVGRRFGSRCLDVANRFAKAFAEEESLDRESAWRTSEEREQTRWRRIVSRVLDDVNDPQACFQELYEHFAHPQAWRVEPGAGEVLAELEKRSYRLGIASNYDHRLRSVLAGLSALGPLNHIVISSEVGWRKPAPEFFQALVKQMQVPASRVLHVGDDIGNDYEGALAAGLRAVLFDPSDKHAACASARIRSLKDLL